MRHVLSTSVVVFATALTAAACGRDDPAPTAPLEPAAAPAGDQALEPVGTNAAAYAASFWRKWRDGTVHYGQTTDNTCRRGGRGGASSDFTYTYQDGQGNDVDLTVKAGPSYRGSFVRFRRGAGRRDDITCCTASPRFRDDMDPPTVNVRRRSPGSGMTRVDFQIGSVGSGSDGIQVARLYSRSGRVPGPRCSWGYRTMEGSGPWTIQTPCRRGTTFWLVVRAYQGRNYGPWSGGGGEHRFRCP